MFLSKSYGMPAKNTIINANFECANTAKLILFNSMF